MLENGDGGLHQLKHRFSGNQSDLFVRYHLLRRDLTLDVFTRFLMRVTVMNGRLSPSGMLAFTAPSDSTLSMTLQM
jgi:hypothetical protein